MLEDISEDLLCYLDNLIKCNLRDYLQLFDDTLKPKHYFMLHYKDVISNSGAPRHYWSFQYESKHREFKAYAKNITSRKNICVSLAKKFELQFAYFLMHESKNIYEALPIHIVSSKYCKEIEEYSKLFSDKSYSCYSECRYSSKIYKTSQYFDSLTVENCRIYEINEAVIFPKLHKVFLVCLKIKIIKFLQHFRAYEIDLDNEYETNVTILPIDNVAGPPVNLHKTCSGKIMLRSKQF